MSKWQKYRFNALMLLAAITSIIYILWRIFCTLPLNSGIVSLIAGIALLVAETIGVIEAFSHYRNMSSLYIPKKPIVSDEYYPDVDVLIPTHSESPELLYKTINGCKHLLYPDPSKVHIYLCDDANRVEMQELAQKMNVGYFGLKNNKHAKAGNLNNALSKTNSPLIATFDADMIPVSSFLLETVPYFYMPYMIEEADGTWRRRKNEEIDPNYKIGFIQTPQSFYNPDLFQTNFFAENNIPNEQDYFFKEINIGRNRTKTPIFAGSNTLISREALIKAGGIKVNTITEDFATGIEIQKNGYDCYAIPKVLAHGLAPNDFESLIKQRQRWGRGCVQTLRNFSFLFEKGLSFGAKMSYFSSLLYWWTFLRRFIYILAPILFTVFGVVVVETSLLELLCIWLPSYIIYNRALVVLSGNIRNQKWSNIVDTILFPYLIIPIIAETVGLKLNKFVVTSKDVVASKNTKKRYAIPQIILLAANIVGLFICLRDMFTLGMYANLILVYWLVINGYFLLMSILFMNGRINCRDSERYEVALPVKIKTDKLTLIGTTKNISESGLAIVLDLPEYVPYDRNVEITINYKHYSAVLKGLVVHVSKISNKEWLYSIEITEMDENNKAEYYQIVYDRDHTLANTIKSGVIKDILSTIKGYTSTRALSNRKLPRIELNAIVKSSIGDVRIVNFNYEYITMVPEFNNKKYNGDIELFLSEKLKITCKKVESFDNLYIIYNWKSIANNEELKEFLKNKIAEG